MDTIDRLLGIAVGIIAIILFPALIMCLVLLNRILWGMM